MAASTLCRRLCKIGANSFLNPTKSKQLVALNAANHHQTYSSATTSAFPETPRQESNYINTKYSSQLATSNNTRLFLVDSLALVRALEAEGFPPKQAEALTETVTKVLNESLESVAYFFVTKPEMHNYEINRETNLTTFKTEIQSSQGLHVTTLQRETAKLHDDIEKLRSELKYAIDKVTAGQKLDLNLERGRIRDELANKNEETGLLTNKLDKEIYALKAHLEAHKAEVLKYCVATLVSVSAVGIAVACLLL